MKKIKKADINRNVTFSISKKLYEEYMNLCKKSGWVASRRIEIFMERELMVDKAK